MAMDDSKNISVVVVVYYPDVEVYRGLNRLAEIFNVVFAVDNTPENIFENDGFIFNDNVKYTRLGDNKGISTALNIGAHQAFNAGYEFVLFLDQDSNPSLPMVSELLSIMSGFDCCDNVAVVGPAYFDTRLGKKAPFITFKHGRLNRIPAEGHELIDVDYVITSGSVISRRSWESVGIHDESLFIDYVDIEWCFRAKSRGWRVIGVPYVIMEHTLGDEPINVLGKKLPVHSPIRHYYFFRNCISLLQRDYIPFAFKVREFCFLPIRFLIYSLFTKNRMLHFLKMSKGIVDGVMARTGPYK